VLRVRQDLRDVEGLELLRVRQTQALSAVEEQLLVAIHQLDSRTAQGQSPHALELLSC